MGEEQHGNNLNHEETGVNDVAADVVRNAGPEEPSGAVENAHDADDAGRRHRGNAGHFLQEGSRYRKQRNSAGDVDEQHEPQRVKLTRLHGFAHRVLTQMGELHAFAAVSRQLAAGRRLNQPGSEEDDDEIGDAQCNEGFRRADRIQQGADQGPGDGAREAEAHDGEAGRESPVVIEPVDERFDRRDVADAKADAADGPIEEVQELQRAHLNRQTAADQAEAVKGAGKQRGAARAQPFNENPQKGGGHPEEKDGDAESPGNFREGRVQGRHHRLGKNGPGINRPDADMDHHGRYGAVFPTIQFHFAYFLSKFKKRENKKRATWKHAAQTIGLKIKSIFPTW